MPAPVIPLTKAVYVGPVPLRVVVVAPAVPVKVTSVPMKPNTISLKTTVKETGEVVAGSGWPTDWLMVTVGATRSTVTDVAAEAVPTLPARSVPLAVKECAPPLSALSGDLHVPAVAVAVPTWVAPSSSTTLAPASEVPVRMGVLSLVNLSVALIPVSLAAVRAGADVVGAMVSTVRAKGALGPGTLLNGQ